MPSLPSCMSQNRAFPNFRRAVSSCTKSPILLGGGTAVRRGGGEDWPGSAAVAGGLLVMASKGGGFTCARAGRSPPPTIVTDTRANTATTRATLVRHKLCAPRGRVLLSKETKPAIV